MIDDTLQVSNTDEAKISPAVKNDQVYDIGRILDPAGTTDFNAGAHLEPDVVLEDYIHILYPESNPEHKLVWLRNFNEGAGLSHKCADDAAKVGCSKTATELAGACSDSSVLHTIKADDGSTATATRAPTLLSLLLGALLVLARPPLLLRHLPLQPTARRLEALYGCLGRPRSLLARAGA